MPGDGSTFRSVVRIGVEVSVSAMPERMTPDEGASG